MVRQKELRDRALALEAQLEASVEALAERNERVAELEVASKKWSFAGRIKSMVSPRKKTPAAGKKEKALWQI